MKMLSIGMKPLLKNKKPYEINKNLYSMKKEKLVHALAYLKSNYLNQQ